MADGKLRKIARSPYWQIRYVDIDGVRRQQSSGTGDYEEALKQLGRIEGEIERGKRVEGRRAKRLTLQEISQAVVDDYRINAKRSIGDLKARLNLHILPFFGDVRAGAVTTPKIREYISWRKQEGATNGTINRELTAIKRAFKLAMQDGRLQFAPYIPMLREAPPRAGFFTPEQFGKLRAALPEHLQGFVAFGYWTGWRLGEITGLQWWNVHGGEIRLEAGTTKSGEGRTFPIGRRIRAILERQQKLQAVWARKLRESGKDPALIQPYVFTTPAGQPIREFRKTWAAACSQAGIPVTIDIVHDKKGRVRYKRIKPSLTFHSFRRTAYRRLVRSGVTDGVAMQMVGWSSRETADRYDIVSEADLRHAIERIEGGRLRGRLGRDSDTEPL